MIKKIEAKPKLGNPQEVYNYIIDIINTIIESHNNSCEDIELLTKALSHALDDIELLKLK